jgi:hypothetical protein
MFIPRHPVVENQFCSYGAQTGTSSAGVGGVVCYAGTVVYLDATATNEEPIVYKMVFDGSPFVPFGFAMQKVKTGYHQIHPTGFSMPGDLGSSDVIAQPDYDANGNIVGTKEIPMGVAHLGIWDTVHYTCLKTSAALVSTPTNAIVPGEALFAAAGEGKVTNSTVNATGDADANTGDVGTGDRCSTVEVAKVMKGASIAKAGANINNTTLYPIRIKLLI